MKKVILFFVLISLNVKAQNTFEKIIDTLGAASAVCIQETFDGGYVFCGTSMYNGNDAMIVKLNSIGTIEWAKTYSGPSIEGGMYMEQTSDSGYIVNAVYDAGSLYVKNWLLRLDPNGDTLWTKTYSMGNGATRVDFGNSMTVINNTIYGLTGFFLPQTAMPLCPYLIITFTNGFVLDSNIYNFSPFGSTGQAICKSYDNNGFAITGQHGISPTNTDINLIRTDVVGDTVWARTYDYSYAEQGFALTSTSDSGFIIVGSIYDTIVWAYNIHLIKTNSTGDTLWTKFYQSADEQTAYSISPTTDGGYVLAGHAPNGTFLLDIYLIKTDAFGDTIWTRFFGNTANDRGYFVRQTKDNGYIICGGGGVLGNAGAYIIKTDSMGIVHSSTGLAELNNPFEFNIYPNPSAGVFTIQVKGIPNANSALEIYNISNQIVYTGKIQNYVNERVDLSHLPDGMYMMVIRMKEKIMTSRIIIQK